MNRGKIVIKYRSNIGSFGIKGVRIELTQHAHFIPEISNEDFKRFIRTHKQQLQGNMNIHLQLDSLLTNYEQEVIGILANSFFETITGSDQLKTKLAFHQLLSIWIQRHISVLSVKRLHAFYFILEKAFVNLYDETKDEQLLSGILFLSSTFSKLFQIYASANNRSRDRRGLIPHDFQILITSYLASYPIGELYLLQNQQAVSPIVSSWKRSEVDGSLHFVPDAFQTSLSPGFLDQLPCFPLADGALYIKGSLGLTIQEQSSIANYISQISNLITKYDRQEKAITKKLLTLDRFNTILLDCVGVDDLAYIMKQCEELLHYNRCVLYAYIPWSKEFKGIVGSELSKVQGFKGPLYPNQLFDQIRITKKPMFIKDPALSINKETIELFELSSLIIVPVYYEHEMLGWITLDQMGKEFEVAKDELELLEEIGKRIGHFIQKHEGQVHPLYGIQLTKRELNILTLLAEGYDNRQMGENLHLSEHTVRDYVSSLMGKLKARNRTQVVSTGFRLGLLK